MQRVKLKYVRQVISDMNTKKNWMESVVAYGTCGINKLWNLLTKNNMKSKYINIAINSEATENLRPNIAHLHIEWNIITTTDSFRATILEQKKDEWRFPDVRSFMPKPNPEDLKEISVSYLLDSLKLAKSHGGKKWSIIFNDQDIISNKQNEELPIRRNHFGLNCKVSTFYIYEFFNELYKSWIEKVSFYQKDKLAPLYFIAENHEIKIEHIIMPIKM